MIKIGPGPSKIGCINGGLSFWGAPPPAAEIHEHPDKAAQTKPKIQNLENMKHRTSSSCGAKFRAPPKAGLLLLVRCFPFLYLLLHDFVRMFDSADVVHWIRVDLGVLWCPRSGAHDSRGTNSRRHRKDFRKWCPTPAREVAFLWTNMISET
jgi:hypothetical protein